MVDSVCIVPENTEVFCSRLQCRETVYCFIRIGDSLWIGIFRNTPDSFDRLIFCDQLFYHIHIRSGRCHRHIDHFNSKMFCDRKMSVISRNRTEELYFIQFRPWRASENSVCHRACNRIVHNIQAGITENHNVVFRNFHHVSKKLLRLCDSVQNTIISAVHSIFTDQVR